MNDLWLVRHGATEWSRDGKHTSVTDLPLLPEGEQAATALRDRLAVPDFALVLSSPRQRALRTAELAGHEHPETTEDLAEWAYGQYEGRTTPEIREDDPGWSVWTHGCPGGEDAADVARRLDRVVTRVRDADGPCLAFGHGHAMRALAARWLDLDVAQGRMLVLDPATVSVLGSEHEWPAVRTWNAGA